jgi:hypothetical protein
MAIHCQHFLNMDSILLQNFGASTKPNPKSSIMFSHEFGHKIPTPKNPLHHPSSLIPRKES